MTQKHITETQFRKQLNELAARCMPCDLKDRVMRELRRGGDSNSTHRELRRIRQCMVAEWASKKLAGKGMPAFEAYQQFVKAHPLVRVGPRPMGPKVFYAALEDEGFVLNREGSQVVIVDEFA